MMKKLRTFSNIPSDDGILAMIEDDLNKWDKEHVLKQSAIFTESEVVEFARDGPDEDEVWLPVKVFIICAIPGLSFLSWSVGSPVPLQGFFFKYPIIIILYCRVNYSRSLFGVFF